MAATGAAPDTRLTRVGDALYFDSPDDPVKQRWTLRPGERPEKSLELPDGPCIDVAAAPDADAALVARKYAALDRIAEVTGWPEARTPEGLKAAKEFFPKHLADLRDATEDVPAYFAALVQQYDAADPVGRAALADALRERMAHVPDGTLRRQVADAAAELADAALGLEDHPDLVADIGKRLAATVAEAGVAAKGRAARQMAAFGEAVQEVDDAEREEDRAMRDFRAFAERRERVARDDLSYFAENGFLALGPHFDGFLAALNRHMLAVYPQADGEIGLPKTFSERDRGLLASGLVMAMGQGTKVADWFDIPGYRLRRSDPAGPITPERIRAKLETAGILKDGAFHANALEAQFTLSQTRDNDQR